MSGKWRRHETLRLWWLLFGGVKTGLVICGTSVVVPWGPLQQNVGSFGVTLGFFAVLVASEEAVRFPENAKHEVADITILWRLLGLRHRVLPL